MKKSLLLLCCSLVAREGLAACNPAIPRVNPDSRYQLPADGSEVLDKTTGLIWKRCSLGQTWDGRTCAGVPVRVEWPVAMNSTRSQGAGWRVPNVKELETLVETACFMPSINETIFPNTPDDWYWTSTSMSIISAYQVGFYFGDVNFENKRSDWLQDFAGYVRFVRSAR